MTERMTNALNHIKTSVDVDPWAVKEAQKVFDTLDDLKAEIDAMKRTQNSANTDYRTGFISALSNIEGYIAQIEEVL